MNWPRGESLAETPADDGRDDARLDPPIIESILADVERDAQEYAATPTDPPGQQSAGDRVKKAQLKYWAVGLEHGNTWWLFRRVKSRWEPSKIDIPAGKPSGVAKLLSENGGACTRTETATLWPSAERKNTKTTQAVNKLRKSIQQRIRDAGKYQDVPDPLPWDEPCAGWDSAVAFGYAVEDDSGRLTFKTYDILEKDESLDCGLAPQPEN